MGPTAPEETRADVARRRLAELAASFNATLADPDSEADETHDEPLRPRRLTGLHVRVLVGFAVVALIATVWWLLQSRPAVDDDPTSLAVTETTAEPDLEFLIIDVAGEVHHPGIVTVPVGARVHDAIEAAGGTKGEVDLSTLNLARVLNDGEQLRVGLPAAAVGPEGSTRQGSLVNLNTAGATELETLPGVGPATSKAILDWRERNGSFRAVEDLLDIRGIGEATLERLRELVTV